MLVFVCFMVIMKCTGLTCGKVQCHGMPTLLQVDVFNALCCQQSANAAALGWFVLLL